MAPGFSIASLVFSGSVPARQRVGAVVPFGAGNAGTSRGTLFRCVRLPR